jgi:anthranilate 3-monooxygenase (FAD)/4-hydroxyphenylacetate 3-monooxygenase
MAVRTGQEYIDGLNDDREVWYGGQRVENVAEFEEFKPSVTSLARLYDLQHDPKLSPIMTCESEDLGEVIARPFEIPRTLDHLRLKRECYIAVAEATCGMMGRSPDFLNAMMASLAAKRSFFHECAPERAEAMVGYYEYVARNDLFLTHALLDPQLDKGKLRSEQSDPGTPLRIVDRNANGLILDGIKRIATSAPYADEILVWPFPPTFQPGEEPYANVFAVPMNTKGLKTLCRRSFSNRGRSEDFPLSSQFDEMDATVVFDNVLVPWERVFLHEDTAFLNRMYKDTRMREMTAHQTNSRLEVKLGFVYALLVRMAAAAGTDNRSEITELLGEAALRVEVIRNTTRSAELQATVDPDNGVLYPDLPALQVGRALGPVYYPEMIAMIRTIGGGGLIQLPVSIDEFDSPIGTDLAKSLTGSEIGGRDKMRQMKLAWDLCGSEFGARHELYEMNYAGERGALLASVNREYSRKQRYLDHLDTFMDSL